MVAVIGKEDGWRWVVVEAVWLGSGGGWMEGVEDGGRNRVWLGSGGGLEGVSW